MQEIKSTQNIEKQIFYDAQKKAQIILQNADDECKKINDQFNLDFENIKKEKTEFYKNKADDFRSDLFATFALEKQRIELSSVNERLLQKINEYLLSLTSEQRLKIAAGFFDLKKICITNKKYNAFVYGFDLQNVQEVLSGFKEIAIEKIEKTEFGKKIVEAEIDLAVKEGIILEATDNSQRIRITLSEVINELLENNRQSLYESLFTEAQNE